MQSSYDDGGHGKDNLMIYNKKTDLPEKQKKHVQNLAIFLEPLSEGRQQQRNGRHIRCVHFTFVQNGKVLWVNAYIG